VPIDNSYANRNTNSDSNSYGIADRDCYSYPYSNAGIESHCNPNPDIYADVSLHCT
jgi:hypothetical protein